MGAHALHRHRDSLADLYGQNLRQRTHVLIDIAHRDDLDRQAHTRFGRP